MPIFHKSKQRERSFLPKKKKEKRKNENEAEKWELYYFLYFILKKKIKIPWQVRQLWKTLLILINSTKWQFFFSPKSCVLSNKGNCT